MIEDPYLDKHLAHFGINITAVCPIIETLADSVVPYQMLQNATSDQGLHCFALKTANSVKKETNLTEQPLNGKWTFPAYKDRPAHLTSMD